MQPPFPRTMPCVGLPAEIPMKKLEDRVCEPCRGAVDALGQDKIELFRRQLSGWAVVDGHHLHKRYETKDFQEALALVNRFGAVAEEQAHHPVLRFTWGWVEVDVWTHKIDGLTLSDFVLAARLDRSLA